MGEFPGKAAARIHERGKAEAAGRPDSSCKPAATRRRHRRRGRMTAAATPLGQLLIDRGLIATEDLDRALELQRERRGEKLGKILVDMGYIAQRDLLSALSEQLGLPIAQLGAPAAAPEVEGLSPLFLRKACIFPVAIEEGSLTRAMSDPLDFETI